MPADAIQLVVSDVDGVLTDGSIGLSESGHEFKLFSVYDGLGVKLLQRAGIEVAFLSSRATPVVEARAAGLGIELVTSGAEEKLPQLEAMAASRDLDDLRRVAYVGDDLVDLPCLRRVGFPVAVANAREEVRAVAELVTELPGGRGAFRELAEFLLKARGLWDALMEAYR